MVEISGAFTYSTIRAINNKVIAGTYSVFPNPANEVAIVKWNNEQLQPMSISIFTMGGRQVNASYKMERTRAVVELSELAKGVYILKLDNKMGSSYQKLIKQ